jgi:hypothetical protein
VRPRAVSTTARNRPLPVALRMRNGQGRRARASLEALGQGPPSPHFSPKRGKFQTPSAKSQTMTKRQSSMTQRERTSRSCSWNTQCLEHWTLGFGACLSFGVCDLVLPGFPTKYW